MYYTDTHIHLQDYNPADIKNIVTNAQKNNIRAFVNVSAHPDDWDAVVELADAYPQIIPALGIHPWYIDEAPVNWQQRLEQQLRNNPAVWLGECGIDRLKNTDTAKQLTILHRHIELAQTYSRPLIIHAVKADEILRPVLPLLPEKTVFHSFTGSAEWGLELQKHGFYLGFNFSILRKKNYDKMLQRLNPHLFLLETDGPYQSGQKEIPSLPQNLPELAAKLATACGQSVAEFAEIICRNWHFFKGE